MTSKRYCKCGRLAICYASFLNKLTHLGMDVHSCIDHYDTDLNDAMKKVFPHSEMEKIKQDG